MKNRSTTPPLVADTDNRLFENLGLPQLGPEEQRQ